MKYNLNKLLLVIVGLLLSTTALAHDFEVDGIYYNYLDKTAKTVIVTCRGTFYNDYSNEYIGAVTIPSSVTYNDTVYSVTKISYEAFYNCTGLTSVTIPNSVTEIGNGAFWNCEGLTEVNIFDLSAWCKIDFGSYDANPLCFAKKLKLNGIEIKDLVIPNDITEIKRYTFYGCKDVTSVTIPSSVTFIDREAFRYCSGLTEVTIPNSVVTIGVGTFDSCKGLTKVTIGNSVTSIGDGAFWHCNNLSSVNIPNSVTEICSYAFRECTNLSSINIPNSVTSIGKYAFYYCPGLTEISIGNSVTSIGQEAFWSCHGLTSITIPNSVTEIGSGAFNNCLNLKLVINLSNLTFSKGGTDNGNIAYYANRVINAPNGSVIGDFVFYKADNVNKLGGYFGNANELILPIDFNGENYEIGNSVFSGFSNFTSVIIPNSVTKIDDYAFYDCTSLTEVNISDLSAWCKVEFNNCYANPLYYAKKIKLNGTEIKELVIPNDITEIKNYAFYGCGGITSVTIPTSVNSIGSDAFYNCDGIKTIVTLKTTPPTCTSSNSFYNYSVPILYVPKESFAKYFIDEVWGQFSNIKKIETLVSSIKLNNTTIELDKGSTTTLTATITPTEASIKDIAWNSSNPHVAMVDQSGNVSALSPGTATITASAIDGSYTSATCNVVVKDVETKITLSQTEANIFINDIITLTYNVVPSTIAVEWSTSDANVAYIKKNSDNSLTVVGVSKGVATITATALDGSGTSASCIVTVGQEPQITLSQTEANLIIDDIIILSYSISNSPIQTATWTISDEKIAKIKVNSNGTVAVTGVAVGRAIITATLTLPSGAECSASCEVVVGSSGVEYVKLNAMEVARYDIHGRLISEPTKGVNIIKYSDGTTRKEIIKE